MTRETDNQAAAIRERVLRSADRYWSLDDLDDPAPAALRELSRLVASGALVRVRRGLYWRGRMTPFGMAPPPDVPAIRKLLGQTGVGPAGASAAMELGLSRQVPVVTAVAAPRRVTVPSSARLAIVTRSARVGRTTARLGAADVALLEVLESWDRVVDVPVAEAVARIVALADDRTIDLDRVVRASCTEPVGVRARLRSLLGMMGRRDLAARVVPPRSASVRERADALFGAGS